MFFVLVNFGIWKQKKIFEFLLLSEVIIFAKLRKVAWYRFESSVVSLRGEDDDYYQTFKLALSREAREHSIIDWNGMQFSLLGGGVNSRSQGGVNNVGRGTSYFEPCNQCQPEQKPTRCDQAYHLPQTKAKRFLSSQTSRVFQWEEMISTFLGYFLELIRKNLILCERSELSFLNNSNFWDFEILVPWRVAKQVNWQFHFSPPIRNS